MAKKIKAAQDLITGGTVPATPWEQEILWIETDKAIYRFRIPVTWHVSAFRIDDAKPDSAASAE